MPKKQPPRRPVISSLSMQFKKATQVTEDAKEAKREHRGNLKNLIDSYLEDVQNGTAEGIRNAKELVEVIKLDLLLLGEATDRTETNDGIDEVKVQRLSSLLDENDPKIQELMGKAMMGLNMVNDDSDQSIPKNKENVPPEDFSLEEQLSLMMGSEDVEFDNGGIEVEEDTEEDE